MRLEGQHCGRCAQPGGEVLGLVDDGADGVVRVQVLSGLKEGDRIVVNKLGRLRTGSPVRVKTGDR